MRLPLKTQYACQVLAQIARTYSLGEVRQVEELAAAEKLSSNYLVQILTELRRAGLVVSRRGKNGGYLLAREPEEISLSEIAVAMEGGELIESSPSNGGHSGESVSAIWHRVNEGAMALCEGIALSDMIAEGETEAGDWMI